VLLFAFIENCQVANFFSVNILDPPSEISFCLAPNSIAAEFEPHIYQRHTKAPMKV
jgi:hypothetical protein